MHTVGPVSNDPVRLAVEIAVREVRAELGRDDLFTLVTFACVEDAVFETYR